MTIKRTVTVEVEMTSEASEADLTSHIDSFVSEISTTSGGMRHRSWHQTVEVGWDESYPVEIRVTATTK